MIGVIQANVFQIGASCGVVFEFGVATPEQGKILAERMRIVIEAVLALKGIGNSAAFDPYELDGMQLHEIFQQIAEEYLRSE